MLDRELESDAPAERGADDGGPLDPVVVEHPGREVRVRELAGRERRLPETRQLGPDDVEPAAPAVDLRLPLAGVADAAVEQQHRGRRARWAGPAHSHSIVAGGFEVTSRTTRFTAGTSLTIRDEISSSRSYGSRAQSAVIASSEVTARITIG